MLNVVQYIFQNILSTKFGSAHQIAKCRKQDGLIIQFYIRFLFENVLSKSKITAHTEKVSNANRGCRLWDVKNSYYKNSSPTEVKRTFIHQNLSILIPKSLSNFCHTKNSPQNQCTYISVLEIFHIKFMFISFSLCCNHFSSLAYEIFYARKVNFLNFSVCVCEFKQILLQNKFNAFTFTSTVAVKSF
jgi:hypothetical protein